VKNARAAHLGFLRPETIRLATGEIGREAAKAIPKQSSERNRKKLAQFGFLAASHRGIDVQASISTPAEAKLLDAKKLVWS
jgi:hypothetical protein